jgi:hypothetical protein
MKINGFSFTLCCVTLSFNVYIFIYLLIDDNGSRTVVGSQRDKYNVSYIVCI